VEKPGDKGGMAVDRRTENWIRRRLQTAKKKVEAERLRIDRARQRRDYWAAVVTALENRLNLNDQGQLEFDLNESNRQLDL
jgi:hypothetical protein